MLKRKNDKRRAKPASAKSRKSVSWGLTQNQIDQRLEFCADPDVHGLDCVCVKAPIPDYDPTVKHPTELIVERVFRAIYPSATRIAARFEVNECWYVQVDAEPLWEFQVGSDDDYFSFERSVEVPGAHPATVTICERVVFPFPSDWPME